MTSSVRNSLFTTPLPQKLDSSLLLISRLSHSDQIKPFFMLTFALIFDKLRQTCPPPPPQKCRVKKNIRFV